MFRFLEWLENDQNNFLTSDERDRYHDLLRSVTHSNFDPRPYKYVKQLYHKKADRSFLNRLHFIHWANVSSLAKLFEMKGKKPELSVNGYLNPPYDVAYGRDGTGIMLKGWITLGSNSDIMSGHGGGRNRNVRYAEPPMDPVTGPSDFRPRDPNSPIDYYHNEFIIANWLPLAFVDRNAGKEYERMWQKHITQPNEELGILASQVGLPVIDRNGETIQA